MTDLTAGCRSLPEKRPDGFPAEFDPVNADNSIEPFKRPGSASGGGPIGRDLLLVVLFSRREWLS